MSETSIIESQEIKSKIYIIRGVSVMLDRDLAILYQVKTIALRQQVKRNIDRFPEDFVFQLTENESKALVSQNVIPTLRSLGGSLPYVFTEHGISMLSSVLKSKMAVEINILIIREFIESRKNSALQPDNELLKERVKRIEHEIKDMRSNQIVENHTIAGKVTQLSREVNSLNQNIQYFSEVLNEFQNAHIIIKRPDEDKFEG